MVKQTYRFSKKKKNHNPIYASADSSSKAKTEIRNKPNLKKKNLISHQQQLPTDSASASNSSNRAHRSLHRVANSSFRAHRALEVRDRFDRIGDRSHLASIPSSPWCTAQRCCPSGLPTPLRYFIFTLYFSLFLSYIFGLKGLLLWSELSVSLFLFIWRLKWLKWDSFSLSLFDSLSLSLWSLNHNWLSFTLVF